MSAMFTLCPLQYTKINANMWHRVRQKQLLELGSFFPKYWDIIFREILVVSTFLFEGFSVASAC